MGTRFKVKSLFLPFLNKYDLSAPYNINYYNIRSLWKALRSYLDKHEDDDTVYARLIKRENSNKEEIFQDVLSLLFAGHETSSHAIGSTMYFLYKFPKVRAKLERELKELENKSHEEIKEILTKAKLEEFEYLHLVVKEALRIDPPAGDALPYDVLADTEICGVKLKKGDVINVNILMQHLNPRQWHDPLKFIPERFNPENKLYTTPITRKARDSMSFIPFSTHLRNCPGQTLAMLEIKVLVAYMLSRVNFDFAEHLIESEHFFFSMISNISLDFSANLKDEKN
jgi:cytochrome P450